MKKTSTGEWIFIGIILSLLLLVMTPPFTFLILSWVICFCSLGNLLFTSVTFSRFKKIIFAITLLWASYLTGSTEFNPLAVHIKGGQFDNVPVAEVLQYFAKQRIGHAYWSFTLRGDKLSTQKVSLLIPDDVPFQEVLDTISQSTNCQYKWNRSGGICGNDPNPRLIHFELIQANEPSNHRLYISSSTILSYPK